MCGWTARARPAWAGETNSGKKTFDTYARLGRLFERAGGRPEILLQSLDEGGRGEGRWLEEGLASGWMALLRRVVRGSLRPAVTWGLGLGLARKRKAQGGLISGGMLGKRK